MKMLDKVKMPKKTQAEQDVDLDLEGLMPEMEGKAKQTMNDGMKVIEEKGGGAMDDSEMESVMGLSDISDDELLAEAKKRGIIPVLEERPEPEEETETEPEEQY